MRRGKEISTYSKHNMQNQDIADDTSTQARKGKPEKYKNIKSNIKNWLNIYKEEIEQKFI
jgi:hypothetical protein